MEQILFWGRLMNHQRQRPGPTKMLGTLDKCICRGTWSIRWPQHLMADQRAVVPASGDCYQRQRLASPSVTNQSDGGRRRSVSMTSTVK